MTTMSLCAEHCRQWFAAHDMEYCAASRAAFAQAHPGLCGHAYDVTLRGYERWLARDGARDGLEMFARYLSPRFERSVPALVLAVSVVACPSSGAWDDRSRFSLA